MYKVFVNEKKLNLSKSPENGMKQVQFDGVHSIEMAIDFLENTSLNAINVYAENLDVLWKTFRNLFVEIEASGGIVYNTKNEILFIHRLGKWDLPKGKLEKGETIEENAIREVEEETGLENLILDRFISETFHIYVERDGQKILKKTNWFKMFYEGHKTPVPQTEEGIKKVSWMNEQEMTEQVLPKTFENIKLILEKVNNL